MTMSSSLSTLYLLCYAFSLTLIHAHVVLVHPTPRTNNDYLHTFEKGVCNPSNTCAAFCGDAYDSTNNPLTILPVGKPTILRWKTNVVHQPLQYRLSLNPTSSDEQFDLGNHILTTVTHAEAADPTNVGMAGTFSTEVTLPESALETCSHDRGDAPCVLQLWDVYYFVSCANVLLTTDENEEVGDNFVDGNPTTIATVTTLPPPPQLPEQFIDTILFQGASFDDYRVTFEMEPSELDPILYLERCRTYTFVIDAPGHPFVIKTQPGLGLDNVLDVNDSNYYVSDSFPTEGTERGSFMIRAGEDAVEKGLFYQCTLHEGMVGEIIFVDGGACTNSVAAGGSDGDVESTTNVVGEGSIGVESTNSVGGGEGAEAESTNNNVTDRDGGEVEAIPSGAVTATHFCGVLDLLFPAALVAVNIMMAM